MYHNPEPPFLHKLHDPDILVVVGKILWNTILETQE